MNARLQEIRERAEMCAGDPYSTIRETVTAVLIRDIVAAALQPDSEEQA